MKKIIFILIILFSQLGARSQQIIEVQPLFEYPVAPDELESIQDKCDYLVKEFWEKFDFKQKNPVDQYALNNAFQVYVTAFQFANAKEVDKSIEKLLKNLSGNPVLMLQFGKAAEENLYGIRADFWSDEIYLKFLDAIVKNKKIPEARKSRYIDQSKAIASSAVGNKAPSFWFENNERQSKQYFPMSTPTLLIFGNPDDTDWRLTRIRMDSNLAFSDALQKGKINVLYILPFDLDNWADMVSNYNKYWITGQSIDAKKQYDIRMYPSLYIVDSEGKIIDKNIPISNAIDKMLELTN